MAAGGIGRKGWGGRRRHAGGGKRLGAIAVDLREEAESIRARFGLIAAARPDEEFTEFEKLLDLHARRAGQAEAAMMRETNDPGN